MLFNFYFINQNSKHQKNETKEVIRIINSGSRRRKKMIYIVVCGIYIYIYYLAHQQKYNQSYQIIKLKQDIVILH